jgi:hypothetical protein
LEELQVNLYTRRGREVLITGHLSTVPTDDTAQKVLESTDWVVTYIKNSKQKQWT